MLRELRTVADAVPSGAVEILHVLDGSATLWLENDAVELIPGRSVVIPSGLHYRARADGLTLLAATVRGSADAVSVTDRPAGIVVVAPDGSGVRPLARASGGSLAEFELAPGTTSKAVRHYELEEVWRFVAGSGDMWLDGGDPFAVEPGATLTIPARVAFQFRNRGEVPLRIVGLTLPAWPLDRPESEVVDTGVTGPWAASAG